MSASQLDNTQLSIEEKRFYLLVAMIFFAVIAALMIVFAFTFIKDMQTLRNVPDAVWNFLCGTPTDNQIALPLLITIGIVSAGISGALYIWRWRLSKIGTPL